MSRARDLLCALLLVTLAAACGNRIALSPRPSAATLRAPTQAEAETTAEVRPIPLRVGYGFAIGSLEVYFTDPESDEAESIRNGPDLRLAQAIDGAHQTVDVAAYSISLWSIRDALLRAMDRGVAVRMVMETDNLDASVPQRLIAAGIPIVDDQHEGLMHDKFVVIDRAEVWTGSMNFTVDGAYFDNNNLIRIRSPKIAADYTAEFEEMFSDHMFGPDVVPGMPNPLVLLDGARLEVYFSPDDGVARRVTKLLSDAQESIYFLEYSFTSDEFGSAIIERAGEGVKVGGVVEEEQVKSNQGTEYDAFNQAGLDVRLDGNRGLMHHKVFIIDGRIVVTGSYNASASAEENNDENVIILFNPDVAAKFTEEFQRVHEQAQPPALPEGGTSEP